MAGYANPYGGGMAGGIDDRKRQLLAHIMGAHAPNSGGRVLQPGAPFGGLPHFAPNIHSVIGQHPGENFGGVDSISSNQAPPAMMGGSTPFGGSPTSPSNDTGGTQMVFPSQGQSPYIQSPIGPVNYFNPGASVNPLAYLLAYGHGSM